MWRYCISVSITLILQVDILSTSCVIWLFVWQHQAITWTNVDLYQQGRVAHITWANSDQVLYHHTASLGHNKLKLVWNIVISCGHFIKGPKVESHLSNTLYNTVNFCWSTHKRHSTARPKGRGMGCLLWVHRATYSVDLSKLSSIKYLL